MIDKTFTAEHGGPIDVTGDTSQQGQIQLNWGVSPDTKYVTVSYEIYRSVDQKDEWQKVGETDELSFVDKDISWAHFDIMGWNNSARPGRPKGGEVMGVRALFAMLEDRYGA